MGVKDPLARQFYMEMCKIEKWGTRTLDEKIDSQLFERTAISRKPEELIKKELQEVRSQGNVIPDLVFKNELLLPDGFLIIEHPGSISFETHDKFFQHRTYGRVNFSFFAENL